MKTINYFLSLFLSVLIGIISAQAQGQSGEDSTGLPGDNFDLQGALQMFQNASSPEDFEKAINTEGNHVNNLDLDGDGDIDYVRVVGKMDKGVHIFVLQVPVSSTENQDIAVIEIEKTGNETAIIQIIGDEDIYGEQVIVEPDGGGDKSAVENFSNNSNLSGPNASFDYYMPRIVVNVWLWPSVRFIYAPVYRPWVSPWRWHSYPGWWKPWRPFGWHVWHPYRSHYHRPFVVVHTHRVVHAHRIYTPYRSSSVVIRNRHSASVNNYRVTKSRTTVTGPRGNSATVKKTTVTGPRGNKATKVKVRRRH
jgi:hypothetical protein